MGFVQNVSDESVTGPAFALGDAPLVPRPKVFPPFGRSSQRILADMSHGKVPENTARRLILPSRFSRDT